MPWTPEQDERLAALWATGMPTRQIAAECDTTNGAVAGRARRLKLPFRAGPRASAGHSLEAKRQARKAHKAKSKDNPFGSSKVFERQFARIEARMLAADAGRIGVPILVNRDGLLHANEDLHFRACRWPIQGGCCGRNAVAGSSYCEPHLRRSTNGHLQIPQRAMPLPEIPVQLMLFQSLPLVSRKSLVKVA